ncbi:MAG TPA: apolipoprotein N-acyltransferase, partial [Panacibacter sp.]|nr:apolipoprotein N-acyltransferase [Panacibacter sp.]
YWMIPGAEKFTGYSIFYVVSVFIVSSLFFSLYFACLMYCFCKIKVLNSGSKLFILNGIFAASVFCVGEFLLMFVSSGFPWFGFHAGNALTANLYAIQPAAIFGVFVLTFIVVFVNYTIAYFIAEKKWKRLFIPVAIVVAYLLSGYFILRNFENRLPESKPFNVAILAENIPPEMKWDDANGNALVQKLLDLNRQATPLKPDLILWSESAIPWTYRPDDDLVNEVLKITAPGHSTHILGINTAYSENVVYNSAYCFAPDGKVTGRYDKQFLLSLIEKPIGNVLFPFFSSGGFYVENSQQHNAPLNTAFGKAGIMICNESTVPAAAANPVKQGAHFLFNMSNDGWFNDTYIVGLHFYNARLRAVETRKDVAINCNNGISGLVQASGRITAQQRSTDPFVQMVSIQPNSYITTATTGPAVFVYCCALIIIFFTIVRMSSKFKHKKV